MNVYFYFYKINKHIHDIHVFNLKYVIIIINKIIYIYIRIEIFIINKLNRFIDIFIKYIYIYIYIYYYGFTTLFI